jgi:competence protein ComEC
MELSNRAMALLFAVLLLMLLAGRKSQSSAETASHGVWHGELTTVTAKGGMISAEEGGFWVSSRSLAFSALRGDSLLVLGYRRGMFITPFAIRVKSSRSVIAAARRHYRDRLVETISDRTACGLTGGLIMGLRGMIPVGTARAFKQSGTSHLLALSGLHTGIAALVLLVMARFVFGKGIVSGWVAVAGIVLFTFLSGARASTIRAGIMACSAVLWISCRGGKLHLLTVWWIALALSLLLIPETLFDRGAQMSYGAVLSLIVFSRKIGGRLAFVLSPLYAGLAVTVSLAPLMNSIYGGFYWLGPVATVVSLPFMVTVMGLGFAVSTGLTGLLVFLNPVSGLWIQILQFFSHSPVSPAPAVLYPVWAVLLLCLRVFSNWNRFNRRFR